MKSGLPLLMSVVFLQGCETKDTKVVNLCLQVIQRLITSQVLDGKGAKYVVETMWMLMTGEWWRM